MSTRQPVWRRLPLWVLVLAVVAVAVAMVNRDHRGPVAVAPSPSPVRIVPSAKVTAPTPVSPVVLKPASPAKSRPAKPPPAADTKPSRAQKVRYVTLYSKLRNIRVKPTTVANQPVRSITRGQRVATVGLLKAQDPYHDGRPYWVKLSNGTLMWSGGTNAWAVYHPRAEKPSRAQATPRKAVVKAKKQAPPAQRRDVSKASYRLPVDHYRITARFGDGGSHWSLGYHTGLDFAAPTGTPVRAVAAGTVSHSYDKSFGRQARLTLSNGNVFIYCHLSRYGRSGKVRAGEIIGYIGTTGNTTGPHLHLEYRPHGGGFGSGRDPQRWFSAHGVHVPASR